MKRLLTACLTLGILTSTLFATAEAGPPNIRLQTRKALNQAIQRNNQVRRQIQRDANRARLSPVLKQQLNRNLRDDAARDRAFRRDVDRNLRQLNSQRSFYPVSPALRSCPTSGLSISPRGIGYSTGGFSVFLGR